MKAALYYGPGDVRIENVAEPSPNWGEVQVRVVANGLCGTDLHQYYSGPMSDAPLPIIVGHEFGGEIVEVGRGVNHTASARWWLSSRSGGVTPVRPAVAVTTTSARPASGTA